MINKFKKIFAKDLYFYGFFSAFIITISQFPILMHILHTPKGYYYPYLDKISFSDYYYLALIQYATGASWLLKIPYVTTPHPASFIQIFFVVLGKISALTGLGAAETFALSRIIGGLVFLLSAVLFLNIIFDKNKARIVFILFLFAQPFPFFNGYSWWIDFFDIWVWHFGEAARRISSVPSHYTLGKGLTILSLTLFILSLRKNNLKYALISAIVIFLAGFIYPPPVFIVSASLILAFLLHHLGSFIQSKKIIPQVNITQIFSVLTVTLAALLPLIILKFELAKGFPWSGWNKVELGWNDPEMHFEWDYFHELGFLIFLVPFSLGKILKKDKASYLNLFILFWFLSPFIFFPFADLLKIGKFRFTEGAQIIPLSILSFWGLETILEILKNRYKSIFVKTVKIVSFAVFTVYFLIFALSQAAWSTVALGSFWTNVYLRPEELKALQYLKENAPANTTVLAEINPSNFIPAFASVKTIIGFPDFYTDSSEYNSDTKTISSILNNILPQSAAKEYLISKKVDYIYREIYQQNVARLYPNLLTPKYVNSKFEIYQFIYK